MRLAAMRNDSIIALNIGIFMCDLIWFSPEVAVIANKWFAVEV